MNALLQPIVKCHQVLDIARHRQASAQKVSDQANKRFRERSTINHDYHQPLPRGTEQKLHDLRVRLSRVTIDSVDALRHRKFDQVKRFSQEIEQLQADIAHLQTELRRHTDRDYLDTLQDRTDIAGHQAKAESHRLEAAKLDVTVAQRDLQSAIAEALPSLKRQLAELILPYVGRVDFDTAEIYLLTGSWRIILDVMPPEPRENDCYLEFVINSDLDAIMRYTSLDRNVSGPLLGLPDIKESAKPRSDEAHSDEARPSGEHPAEERIILQDQIPF